MVELQIVVLAVAGSSPVSHPISPSSEGLRPEDAVRCGPFGRSITREAISGVRPRANVDDWKPRIPRMRSSLISQ
jgi:hypothetical protein